MALAVRRRPARMILALLAAVAVLAGPRPAVIVGGLLLALVLPGAALVGALFRAGTLSRTERLVLAPALSLATLVLGGLLLYVCEIKLDRDSWAGLAAGVALAAGVVEYLRWNGVRPVGQPRRSLSLPRPAYRWVLPLALAGALLGGAGWLSVQSAKAQAAQTAVTALSVSANGSTNATTRQRSITVSVHSGASTTATYRVVISGAGDYSVTVNATIAANQGWTYSANVPSTDRVTVKLYLPGGGSAYRTVFLAGSSDGTT
jgi:hypothetical protein